MDETVFKKSPLQMAAATTIIFMFLNAFLPVNFSSVKAEAIEYPFKLIITLEKTAFKLEEPVNVTWILTNIDDENVTLYNSCDDPLDFLIRDENFNDVFRYRSYVSVIQVIYPFAPIAPGDNMTMTGIWKQIYDGSGTIHPVLWYKQVPPGSYYVFGAFRSSTYGLEFETSPLRITIIGR